MEHALAQNTHMYRHTGPHTLTSDKSTYRSMFLAFLGIEFARVLGLFAGRLVALDLVAEGRTGARMAASSDDCSFVCNHMHGVNSGSQHGGQNCFCWLGIGQANEPS